MWSFAAEIPLSKNNDVLSLERRGKLFISCNSNWKIKTTVTCNRQSRTFYQRLVSSSLSAEGREGGYQIPVPSLNLAQIPVPRLIFAKIPVTSLQFKSNKSLEFSVCITALFALTYLISSTILRETFSEAIFIFPSQYLHMQTCRTCPLTRKTDRT